MELTAMREERLQQMQTWAIIREICFCLSLIFFFNVVVNSQFPRDAFQHVKHLGVYFGNSRQPWTDFQQVSIVSTTLLSSRVEFE